MVKRGQGSRDRDVRLIAAVSWEKRKFLNKNTSAGVVDARWVVGGGGGGRTVSARVRGFPSLLSRARDQLSSPTGYPVGG